VLESATPWPMPAETAAVGKVILKADSPYRLIGELLFEKFSERDYADLYSPEGKPAISPVILAFVTRLYECPVSARHPAPPSIPQTGYNLNLSGGDG
jgi:hypothetical protein